MLLAFLVPGAAGQTVSDRLADLRFAEIVVTVGPTDVGIDAHGGNLAGATASDLRKCLDKANCPDSRLEAASRGNGDGRVEQTEVDALEVNAVVGLNAALAFGGSGALADFGRQLRDLVRIDGGGPMNVQIETLDLAGATGSITSTNAIQVRLLVKVTFETADEDRHDVAIARAAADIDMAERIVVKPATGWTIEQDSITPESMKARYSGGSIQGTQAQMQGTEPLGFTIEDSTGLPVWGWIVIGGLSLLVAAGVAYYLTQVRGKA